MQFKAHKSFSGGPYDSNPIYIHDLFHGISNRG